MAEIHINANQLDQTGSHLKAGMTAYQSSPFVIPAKAGIQTNTEGEL